MTDSSESRRKRLRQNQTNMHSTSEDQVPKLIGGLAVALGIALAFATLVFMLSGTNLLLLPSPIGIGGLALIFVFTGIGVCQHLRIAAVILSVAFIGFAFAQVMAAFAAEVMTRTIEHALFALWLCLEPSILWRHRNELK
jgi:hypothetical protein